jgi:hypothetical protein
MATRLSDLPARTLATMLRETERAAGPDSVAAGLIRRALLAKRQAARKAKRTKGAQQR